MSWLLIITLSYFFFSLSSLGDKIILSGPPKPKSYTFYVGLLSGLAFLIIPFINFTLPDATSAAWIVLESMVYVLGLYSMFVALEKFDVSKVIPIIGATQPIFVFILTWMFWGQQEITVAGTVAFVLLLIGSVVLSVDKTLSLTAESLKLATMTSLMFSMDYVFTKFVYEGQPFLQGFVWMRIVSFLIVLCFLFGRSFRQEIFEKQNVLGRQTGVIFLSAQAAGGIANILQSFAISLAPVAFLAIMNSMKGIQYVFLFAMTTAISFFVPQLLKEELSRKVLLQKVFSILLIAAGMIVLFME